MSAAGEMLQSIEEYRVNYDDFHIEKLIGKGGYGEVYLAEHKPTKTICAVKKFNIESIDAQKLTYFSREVMVLSKCNNKFLLPFIGFTDTPPYVIVTKYIPRGSLFDALQHKSGSPILTGTNKTLIALGIAKGMEYLHEQNIIHRDLKSLNILLDQSSLPKICDFGISRFFAQESNQYVTKQIGTPHWMAPEMFNSTNYDSKVDVYAFGILLWEMLTEKVPYAGMSSVQIALHVCEQRRPEIPEDAPDSLRALITLCWQDDPLKRPSFSKIYRALRDRKITFPNTDESFVISLINFVEDTKFDDESDFGQSLNSSRFQSDILNNIKNEIPENYVENLKDHESPFFLQAFVVAISNINHVNARHFFSTISGHLESSTIKLDTLNEMLDRITKVLNADQNYILPFVEAGTLNHLPYKNEDCFDHIMHILICVANESPESISLDMILYVTARTYDHMKKVLSFFSALASTVGNHPSVVCFLNVLVDETQCIIQTGYAAVFIQILSFLLEHSTQFVKEKQSLCQDLFWQAIQSVNHHIVRSAYSALIHTNPKPIDKLPIETICQHFFEEDLRDDALSYLSSYETVPLDKQLMRSLIMCSQTSDLAFYVLCKMADSNEGSIFFIKETEWIEDITATENLMKLFMVVFSRIENRKNIIISDPIFLDLCLKLAESGDPNILKALSFIITQSALDEKHVDQLGRIFEKYIYNTLGKGNNQDDCSCLKMFSHVASVSYSNQFRYIIPKMPGIINSNTKASLECLKTASFFSSYKELLPIFEMCKIKESIEKIIIPEDYKTYKSTFLHNISDHSQ